MAALLHDAAEAYLGDLPHPIKHRSELGAHFKQAEKRLEAVIERRFELPDAAVRIKAIDRALLATERRRFSRVTWNWPELEGVEPLDIEIEPWPPERAAREFLERYERLQAQRGASPAPPRA
jgi:5'-deoxynucleotidase YfbR-like HD superfamily hydrolase